jgi:hypothetical protein
MIHKKNQNQKTLAAVTIPFNRLNEDNAEMFLDEIITKHTKKYSEAQS